MQTRLHTTSVEKKRFDIVQFPAAVLKVAEIPALVVFQTWILRNTSQKRKRRQKLADIQHLVFPVCLLKKSVDNNKVS